MRVLTSTLAALTLFLSLALAAAEAPQASAGACVPSCPLSDKNGSDLASRSADNQAGTITCFYPASTAAAEPEEFSCTYSSANGQLTADHDEEFCPSSASTGCGASRRKRGSFATNKVQNVVRKHSAALRAAAVHGDGNSSTASQADLPDYVKSRALLSRRFRPKY